MIALKRILVPHDFSETSARSLSYATALARSFAAELVFLHVDSRTDAEAGAEASAAAGKHLLTMLTPADRAAVRAEVHVRAGAPDAEIVRFAAEHDIDLIVMGTHGRGFVGHMVMGSVAEKVVRTAPCPVLTVRNPGQVVQGMDVVAEARAAV